MSIALPVLILIAAVAIDPAPGPDLSTVVAKLGSADPAERASASSALEALGRGALPALRQARESPDVHVRDRASALWETIQRSLLTQPTRVRLVVEDRPLADAITDLQKQTSLPLRMGHEERPAPVTVREAGPVAFWEAVGRLGLTGARFEGINPHGAGFPNLVLSNAPEWSFTSISGSFRIALGGLHLRRDRRFVRAPWVEIDGMGQRIQATRDGTDTADGKEVVTYSGGLDVMVEPRMWFTQEAPARLTEAVDDLGQSLVGDPTGDSGGCHAGYDFAFFTGGGVTTASTRFLLRPTDRPGRFARLRGVIPVMLHLRRPDPALVIPLAGAAGKTFRCDDAEFSVLTVNESPTSTSVTMNVRLNVARADLPEHADSGLVSSRLMFLGHHQLDLVDSEGNVLVDSAGSGGGGGNTPEVYQWTISTFPKGGATHLRYFGMIRSPYRAAFDFRDVPLP